MAVAAVTPETRTFDSAAATRLLDGRYAEVRQCAGRLVDAFGIPDEVLGAPIGLDAAAAQR